MSNDSHPVTNINWPSGITEQHFLDHYWQKKPLLIRQALPGFQTPLPADELAGLSLEPDTTPRLITQAANGSFHLEHGPFGAQCFETLTGNDWSLLVTDVEKHIPELQAYLQPFRFLPSWRIDDLMISYAPVGASVGAHIDEYDVFLLQASGKRQWSIDADALASHELVKDSELKLLAGFEPSDSWELKAGDILYLPPGIAHHGVASEDECTTWSIGFRAPAVPDLIMRMTELLCDTLPHSRYTDPPLKRARSGEITTETLQCFHDIWTAVTTLKPATISHLLGQILSESVGTVTQPSAPDHAPDGKHNCTVNACAVHLSPFSRIAWHHLDAADRDTDAESASVIKLQRASQTLIEKASLYETVTVCLYVDGNSYQCSEKLATQLSDLSRPTTVGPSTYSAADCELCNILLTTGSLMRIEFDRLD